MAAALIGLLLFPATLSACTGDADPEEPTPSSPSPDATVEPVELTFAVYGQPDELEAYDRVLRISDSLIDDAEIEMISYPSHEQAMARLQSGKDLPDLFMINRSDLPWLTEADLTQPVGDLLDERDVAFGDQFNRDSLLAMSYDEQLQCLPYGYSPMVLYVNTELVDFDKMKARDLPTPSNNANWSLEEFAAAADFAARPCRGTFGAYVEPTLVGLSPFIYSGGGDVYDDPVEPTSLAFTSEDTMSALEQTLTVLRDPKLTLGVDQLAQAGPLTWFKRGKLGMIAGYRELVPELRRVRGLEFDVLGMPNLGEPATVGDSTAICISRDTKSLSASADALLEFSSREAVRTVTREGYLVPVANEVAQTDDFLQPGRQPEHSSVFRTFIRYTVPPPLISTESELQQLIDPMIEQLVDVPLLDLEAMAEAIDAASVTVLAPDSASPSASSG